MQRRHYGDDMLNVTAIGAGILCYWVNIMCRYDLETGQTGRRIRYFLRMDRKRCVSFMAVMIVSLSLTRLFAWYHYGPLKVVRYLLLLAVLYPIAMEDARQKKIPNRWLLYILAGRGVLFVWEAVTMPSLIGENLIFTLFGGTACGAVFLLVYLLSGHAVGMGDVKLVAVIGTCLGFRTTYLAMFAASILSAVYGVVMVLRKKKKLKDEMAFGPFIAIGTLVVLLIGA